MSDIEALTASENETKAEDEAKHVLTKLAITVTFFNQINYI